MLPQRKLLIACLSTALVYSGANIAHAGFEWVPSQQKSAVRSAPVETMVIDNAPVAPVANEVLQPAATQQQVVVAPAPAPVSIDPANEAMMPLPGEVVPAPKMQTITIAPPPSDANGTMQPQELKSSETQIDLPTPSTDAPNAPIMLVPETNKSADNTTMDETPEPRVPAAQDKLMIQPFPIMKTENKPVFNDPMVQIAAKQAAPAPQQMNTLSEAERTDAVGFGKDMPLALAVQQIVPPGYAYSFAQSVNAGQRVSWSGGKAWDLVLQETLEPIGMNIRIDGKSVMVVQDTDQMSQNEIQTNVQSIEPAAGTEIELEAQISPAAALIQTPEAPQTRSKISDPGETASIQPDLSAIEMPEADGVQMQMDVTESEAVDNTSAQIWSAKKGDSLKTVLHDWAKQSNTQIIWEASYDYRLDKDLSLQGSLEEAYNELLSSYNDSESKPNFRFVKQNKESDNMALIIVQDAEEAQPVTG